MKSSFTAMVLNWAKAHIANDDSLTPDLSRGLHNKITYRALAQLIFPDIANDDLQGQIKKI